MLTGASGCGHSHHVQQPVELHAARESLRRGGASRLDGLEVLDEAERWRVLLQDSVDGYGDMIGYWLLREDDLAAGRFDRAYFETQR